jgi:hypothetical protein
MRTGPIIFVFALFSLRPVAAQFAVEPRDVGKVAPLFERFQGHNSLSCEIRPMHPLLNFGFRIQAGYWMTTPLKQFESGEKLVAVTRVAAKDSERDPVYFTQAMTIPQIPPDAVLKKVVGQLNGGYFLGEGAYQIDVILIDEKDRFCRGHWKAQAKTSRRIQAMKAPIPPATALAMVTTPWSNVEGESACQTPIRLTVLLHAAPIRPWATKLRAFDKAMLLSSVAALMEQTPCAQVRLVAFNLDQQKQIFEQEHFNAAGFEKLAHAMDGLGLGTIDIGTLNNSDGPVELFYRLLNQERRAAEPADAVLLLSPGHRWVSKVLKGPTGQRQGIKPSFFYFDFKPYLRMDAMPDDWMGTAVKSLDGKVMRIYTPESLASAIQLVLRSVGPAANPRGESSSN